MAQHEPTAVNTRADALKRPYRPARTSTGLVAWPGPVGANHCPLSSPTHSLTTAESSPDLGSEFSRPMLKIRLIVGRSLTNSAEALTRRSPP